MIGAKPRQVLDFTSDTLFSLTSERFLPRTFPNQLRAKFTKKKRTSFFTNNDGTDL